MADTSRLAGRFWQIAHRLHEPSLLIDFTHMVSPSRICSIEPGRYHFRNGSLIHWCGVAAFTAVMLGCSEDTSIRQYRVAKSETQRNTASASLSSTAAVATEQLMLAAIVPNQDFAWFFKLTGDPEKVLESDAEFRSMIKSVAFDGAGQPSWKLHEGWQQQITPEAITYGKLTNDEAGLTATVTRLPFDSNSTEDSWRGYIVSNINRWRGQLSLGQQEWEQMSSELEEFPELSQGPAKAYFVSIAGTGSGGMSAPFMNRAAGSPPAAASRQPAATTDGSTANGSQTQAGTAGPSGAASGKPITYTVPEGWTETSASGMRMAAFSVGSSESGGEVTVIAAGGGIEANIGIWLGQVGAEVAPETTSRILAEAEEVTVHSVATKLYTIDGPATAPTASSAADAATANANPEPEPDSVDRDRDGDGDGDAAPVEAAETVAEAETQTEVTSDAEDADKELDGEVESAADATIEAAGEQPQATSGQTQAESETILIADIPWRDGQSLFVKFKGPTSLAGSQRKAFIEFVKSIQWN